MEIEQQEKVECESMYVGSSVSSGDAGEVEKDSDFVNCILEVFDNFDHNYGVGLLIFFVGLSASF